MGAIGRIGIAKPSRSPMNKRTFLAGLAPLLAAAMMSAHAQPRPAAWVRSPAPGVLCDPYMCANDKGISRSLTERHIGRRAAARLFSQGDFSRTEFTFANGVFCDVNGRICRMNRYFDANGKRSGAVSKKYTALLFGK